MSTSEKKYVIQRGVAFLSNYKLLYIDKCCHEHDLHVLTDIFVQNVAVK